MIEIIQTKKCRTEETTLIPNSKKDIINSRQECYDDFNNSPIQKNTYKTIQQILQEEEGKEKEIHVSPVVDFKKEEPKLEEIEQEAVAREREKETETSSQMPESFIKKSSNSNDINVIKPQLQQTSHNTIYENILQKEGLEQRIRSIYELGQLFANVLPDLQEILKHHPSEILFHQVQTRRSHYCPI